MSNGGVTSLAYGHYKIKQMVELITKMSEEDKANQDIIEAVFL